jgi:hypothetical protein
MRSGSKQSPRGRLRGRPLCGAKTRAGGSCKVRAEPGKARCRFHGGKSTGPRTQAGRGRIAEAQRRRWRSYRARPAARHVSKSEAGEEAPAEATLQLNVAMGDTVTLSGPRQTSMSVPARRGALLDDSGPSLPVPCGDALCQPTADGHPSKGIDEDDWTLLDLGNDA